jgi:hypothetical protein
MLYIVPTPIGHLGDITHRALEVLSQVDIILAEDTRVTKRLLSRYEIKTPLKAYHAHNERPLHWFPMQACPAYQIPALCWCAHVAKLIRKSLYYRVQRPLSMHLSDPVFPVTDFSLKDFCHIKRAGRHGGNFLPPFLTPSFYMSLPIAC